MEPFFIIVLCLAFDNEAQCSVWSDDRKTMARYATQAICEKQVVFIEEAMVRLAKKTNTAVPSHVIGCKQVTAVKENDQQLDWNHT